MTGLILLLGGVGARFGSALPKQFATLPNSHTPIYQVACEKLLHVLNPEFVVFAVPASHKNSPVFLESFRGLQNSHMHKKFTVVQGGSTRHNSFRNALSACADQTQKIIVHDANRPYLPETFLKRVEGCLTKVNEKNPCFIPVIPVTDSLLQVDEQARVTKYIERDRARAVQTPQLFHFPAIRKAISEATAVNFTDEGSLFMSLGYVVQCFEGEPENRKITYPQDLLH